MESALVNGRYELGQRLAGGASSEVYQARDCFRDGAPRALKVLRAHGAEPSRDQLMWEFERLGRLEHPHLVRAHDLDLVQSGALPGGTVFLVEDLVDGEPCDRALARLEATARTSALVRLLAEAASALGHLHAHGILHRDVAPRNLLVERTTGAARLVDLGLTLAMGVAGTPAYLAPEALAGAPSARSDLYALGATAWHAFAGRPPHEGEGASLVRSILERDPTPPADLPPPVARVLVRLLARDPAARHGSAAILLEDLLRLADLDVSVPAPPRGQAAAGLVIGRDAELAELCGLLERLARGESVAPVIAVSGPPGSGRSQLIAEARRRVRLAAAAGRLPPLFVVTGTIEQAGAALGVRVPNQDAERALIARDAAVLGQLAARAPALLELSDPGEAEIALAARIARGGVDGAAILIELDETTTIPGAQVIRLPPLGAEATGRLVEALLGRPADAAFAAAIARAAAGLPLAVRELVTAAGAAGDRADVTALGGGAGLAGIVRRRLSALPADARRAAGALAALGGAAAGADVLAAAEVPPAALTTLLVENLVSDAAGRIAFLSAAHAAAAIDEAAPAVRERALLRVKTAAVRARVLASLGRAEQAAAAYEQAGLEARASLDFAAAAEFLQAAEARGRASARLPLGEVLIERGRYQEARALLDRLPPSDPAVTRARARALQRGGDSAAAEAALRDALGQGDDPCLRELLGRLLIARGAFAEARRLGAGPEIEGLAALYLGEHAHADACFARAAAAATDDLARARAALLSGNAAHLAGSFAAAAGHFERALALGERTGDVHTVAPAAGSLGAAKKELGDYAGALEPMRRAVRDLGALGLTPWYGAALTNLGNLLLALGDLPAAERLAGKARTEAARRGSPLMGGFAGLLEAAVHRRLRRPDAALLAAESAGAAFEAAGETSFVAAARRERALALGELGRAADADAALSGLPEDADTLLARARLLLLRGAREAAARDACAAAAALGRAGRKGELWRAHAVAARAGHAESAALARKGLEEILMKTPDIYRDGLKDDPDARLVGGLPAPQAEPAREDPRLRRLLLLNKRLNSELRLPRLLELVLDAVLEFTGAERGFVLLRGKRDQLAVKAARNIDQRTLSASEFALSRSIAERAAREGEPIVTIDAQGDERFSAALSVSDLRLRSVLAVPLRVKGRVSGTIYVDHRLRRGAFGEADVALVLDFAEQAALAIDNARLVRELKRARERAEELAGRLAERASALSAELRDMTIELRSSREALAVRYNYENIVGRTPRMLDLFRLLDRVTETDLPVVVYGESGTGKELAARAIHHNGPRKDRPFVGENCAAIPETLLESTLFGYVRGAFTGAERDTRGLFEVADGGTLFLDEVGEMSPAMQSKLLRVLSDGAIRRIGGERPRTVDVRIIAASNRDLKRLVDEGRFREDLYYRLNVVKVEMPALRERRDDIPLLVEHLLGKLARGGEPRRVTREAMALLCEYDWPGNVRELENEIARAAALAEEAIGPADLSPTIEKSERNGLAAAGGDGETSLRGRVERLERTLIRDALEKTQGNQTRAAQLLGLSRFGLSKKLQRYRIRWQ